MAKDYYVNKQAQNNGDHEVHEQNCRYLPDVANREYLGGHTSCHSAVAAAKFKYRQVNGCKYCSPQCHTQ